MNSVVRTSLRLVISIVLFTAVAMAHATVNRVDKNTNRQQHSRLSKLASWRGHNHRDKTGGNVAKVHRNKSEEHHNRISKLAFWRRHKDGDKSVKTAQANHGSPKSVEVKAVQTKAAHTPIAGKKSQERSGSGTAATKTSAANGPKRQQTTQDRTTASLKQ